ncbi:cytochrome P450 [Tothia fuscella]|uniref:Cytochrome P450 n=1 Tax=Tothia fuscella TaxID=1048955 RepID=A0A9P4NV97_9PEZI|nr:cytochrome P450 [Tothia fuscella]
MSSAIKELVVHITRLPLAISLTLGPTVLLTLLLLGTRIYTTIRYRRALAQHLSSHKSGKALPPPAIPYTLPLLGHARDFLSRPKPGQFFTDLLKNHPRETGACTLLLGGRKTHILFSSSAIQALFKAKGTSRDEFNQQIIINGLGVTREDTAKFYGLDKNFKQKEYKKAELDPAYIGEKINHEKLLRADGVNELTSEFIRGLKDIYATELAKEGEVLETNLYSWLRRPFFHASTTALMGSRLLELCPELEKEFFNFDSVMLGLFFALPKFLTPEDYRIRDTALEAFARWHDTLVDEGHGTPLDPDGTVAWEPVWGSRLNRARQVLYDTVGLSTRGRAGLDLGMLFGIQSNAPASAGWILLHLLDPTGDQTLLPRILEELKTAQLEDGSLNIQTLVSLPLLQSLFQEVLRLYADVLVSRNITLDITLPIESGQSIFIEKGSVLIAPSWLGHYDSEAWHNEAHPHDTFYAERFLTASSEGKQVFTMNGTNGKLFPFGGGKTICPGRVFAKQEVFAAVAMVLLNFKFEVLGFVDLNGKPRDHFPGLKDSYSGSGIMAMDGDIRVKVMRRRL